MEDNMATDEGNHQMMSTDSGLEDLWQEFDLAVKSSKVF